MSRSRPKFPAPFTVDTDRPADLNDPAETPDRSCDADPALFVGAGLTGTDQLPQSVPADGRPPEVGLAIVRLDGAEELAATHTTPAGEAQRPRWDRRQRVLWFDGQVVKRFRRPAPAQEAILDRFQKCGWRSPVDCPFERDEEGAWQEKLHTAIKNLNRSMVNALLHFEGDGTGKGVCWVVRRAAVVQRTLQA